MNATSAIKTIENNRPRIDPVGISLLCIGCVGITGNLVCVAILRRHSFRNHTNWLIANQAVVDSLASTFLVASEVTHLAGLKPSDMTYFGAFLLCKLWKSLAFVFGAYAISTFNLVALSIERYLAVVHPVWYLAHFKRRAVYILAVLTWVLAPLFQMINAFLHNIVTDKRKCLYAPTYNHFIIVLFLWEYLIPVGIMTFSFFAIVKRFQHLNRVAEDRILRFPHSRQVGTPVPSVSTNGHSMSSSAIAYVADARANKDQQESITNTEASTSDAGPGLARGRATPEVTIKNSKPGINGVLQRRNTTKVLIAVYLLYVLCWSPNQWAFLYFHLGGHLDPTFHKFSIILCTLNTCVNPFIYVLRLNIYRRELKSMIFSCVQRVLG
ncbi:G-protein coupled receptor moody-like [Lytechinus pictus]|uniref:G-protein coupled receptor moody-like n=1 Tax=Lytechinus pictus TaxID=7653 RepID=UPI0030B9B4F2